MMMICHLVHLKCRYYVTGVANCASRCLDHDESRVLHCFFYQQSVTHFLLADCDQQRHFRYSTSGLLDTEIPFCLLC